MKNLIIMLYTAGVLALVGCGPDLSTPEGRYSAFRICAHNYVDNHLQLADPGSYELRRVSWVDANGDIVFAGRRDPRYKDFEDLPPGIDEYPKIARVTFRSKNAFGIYREGLAIARIDAVSQDDCRDGYGIQILSVEGW